MAVSIGGASLVAEEFVAIWRSAARFERVEMQTLVLVLHILAAIGIVVLVLLQHGKGADMGAAFGSGSAGSLFGSAGAANFLSRTTAVLAAVFFATSLGLTYFSAAPHKTRRRHAVDRGTGAPKADAKPAAPASSAPAPAVPVRDETRGDPEVAVACPAATSPECKWWTLPSWWNW